MRLIVAIFLISISSVFAEETKYTRQFSSPLYLVEVLKSKYEGKTLKELLSNAGANLAEDDKVFGPNGAGIVVQSSADNLNTIEQIIKSCVPLQVAFHDRKEVKVALFENKWDMTDLGIGILKFNADNTATAQIAKSIRLTQYRWALTKQNVIELRSKEGRMVFTAVVFGNTLHLKDFHAKPQLKITVRSVK